MMFINVVFFFIFSLFKPFPRYFSPLLSEGVICNIVVRLCYVNTFLENLLDKKRDAGNG